MTLRTLTQRAPTPAPPARALPLLHQQLLADGANCGACPLSKHGAPNRPVATYWRGLSAPAVAVVGEAPGRREVMVGVPFSGPSGKILDLACHQGGVHRGDLAILNAAACGPIPRHEDQTKLAAVAACRPRLLTELRRLAPSVILAIGANALRTLAPAGTPGVTALRGSIIDLAPDVIEPRLRRIGAPAARSSWTPTLFSTFHPAHIMSGGDGDQDTPFGDAGPAVDLLYYFFQADLTKAVRFAHGEVSVWKDELDLFARRLPGDEAKDPDGPRPGLYRVTTDENADPTWGERATEADFAGAIERVRDEARALGEVAEDVETDSKNALTAKLTCNALSSPKGGMAASWPTWQGNRSSLELLREINGDGKIHKVFHNKLYDVIVLDRHGFTVKGPVEDTLLQHHGAFPGLAHKLDQVATQFFCTRAWKAEYRHSMRNIPELVLYNGRDAQATVRLRPALTTMLRAHKAELVYEVDRQLATVATQMRKYGYFIDRAEQTRQSKIQHTRLDYMQKALITDFAALEPAWMTALAERKAGFQRKKDPDSFLERVALRYQEIEERVPRAQDIGRLMPKAKDDLVALFEVLKIPITSFTMKGAPVTDKKAMEAASAKHPLMRRLIHLREAANTLALFIDGLPILRDGRVHPDWQVNKISGRWSAGKAQNWQYNIAGWPPEKDAEGKWKTTPSGEWVTPRENPRAQVVAPSVEDILKLPLGCVPMAIRKRAQAGFGRILIGADFDQLELRLAGWLAAEPFLIDGFASGFDPHAVFARICFDPHFGLIEDEFKKFSVKPKADLDKADLDDITRLRLKKQAKQWKRLRDLAKRCEYGAIYGGNPEHLYEALVKDFPELELKNVIQTVKIIEERMPAVVAQRNRWEVEARVSREIREAFLGRARFFPLGNFNPNVVYNFPIQAAASSLLAMAIFRFVALTQPGLLQFEPLYKNGLLDAGWVREMKRRGFDKWRAPVCLIINGHDSLIVEADVEDGEQARVLLGEAMTQTHTRGGCEMTFSAESAVGRRWNDT